MWLVNPPALPEEGGGTGQRSGWGALNKNAEETAEGQEEEG